jgi:hypothetical protein
MEVTRRDALALRAGAAAALTVGASAAAQDSSEWHGISAFGDLKNC